MIGLTTHRQKEPRAFTLIELLVVVAIIVILLTILLPALSYVKKQMQRTSTVAELQSVREACEGYITTFQHYPGAFSDADISASHISGTSFSGTQNMLVSLMGSLSATSISGVTSTVTINNHSGGTSTAYVIPPQFTTSASIGYAGTTCTGPVDLSNGGKQYPGFYAPRLVDITTKVSGTAGTSYSTGSAAAIPTVALPTLVDHFADPLPILYYRKTPGIDSPAVAAQYNTATYPNFNATAITQPPASTGAAFYRNCNAEYTDSTALAGPTGTVCNQNPAVSAGTTAPLYGGSSPNTTVYPNAALASMTLNPAAQVYSSSLQYNLSAVVANESSGVGTLYQCNSTSGSTGNTPPVPPAGNTSYWMNLPTPGGAFMLIAAGSTRMYGASDTIVVTGGQ